MDTFTTKKGQVTGAYPKSVEIAAAGPISTTGAFIDAGGQVAGTFTDAAGTHAFLTDAAGNAAPFAAAAGEQSISVAGIDTAGEVAGSTTGGDGRRHGYLYRNGAITPVDPTGSISTTLSAVDPSGTLAGSYLDGRVVGHGFVDRDGAITTFDVTGLRDAAVSAVDKAGDAAGIGSAGAGYADAVFTEHEGAVPVATLPGTASAAQILGISEAGTAVGQCYDAGAEGYVAFTVAAGATSVTPVSVPDSQYVSVAGIDAAGDVAGSFFDQSTGRHRGFVQDASGKVTTFDAPSSPTTSR